MGRQEWSARRWRAAAAEDRSDKVGREQRSVMCRRRTRVRWGEQESHRGREYCHGRDSEGGCGVGRADVALAMFPHPRPCVAHSLSLLLIPADAAPTGRPPSPSARRTLSSAWCCPLEEWFACTGACACAQAGTRALLLRWAPLLEDVSG